MKIFTRIIQGFMVGIGMLVLATSAQAATYNFANGDGTATVTTSTDTITISLTDTAINPTSVIQNISGFIFTTSTGDAASGLVSPTGTSYINIAADGSYSFGGGPASWGYSGDSTQYVLTWNPAGGSGPAFTIVGVPGAGGYTNANGSLAGNGPHNPFLYHVATFTLHIEGITSDTVVTSGTIMFGTTWSPPTPPSVPEASAMMLFSTGLVGLVVWRRKKRFE